MSSPVGAVTEEEWPDDLVDLVPAPTFDAFYSREYRYLVAFARALTGSAVHAEDIAQEAMLVAYRRWDRVSGLDQPHAWVRRVCANLATSHLRRRVVERRLLLRDRHRTVQLVDVEPEVDEFWFEVRRLPRRQAQCIALKYVYGCSVAEIASTLECKEGTVKMHLFRGRATLAIRLAEEEER